MAEAVNAAFGIWQRQKEGAESAGLPFSLAKLIEDYLSDAHRKNPGTGCPFSTLAAEIARSDKRTRALTSEQVRLVGAMSLARAVSDEALSREIMKTVGDLLKNPA